MTPAERIHNHVALIAHIRETVSRYPLDVDPTPEALAVWTAEFRARIAALDSVVFTGFKLLAEIFEPTRPPTTPPKSPKAAAMTPSELLDLIGR